MGAVLGVMVIILGRVQILDEPVSVSLHAHALGKDMNASFLNYG